jgi:SAM-dependent methyltransferase
VQLEKFQSPGEIFSDYAYFSSYSQSWLQHAKDYVDHMMETVGYDASSQVVELASNDGYLLRNFRDLGVPVLGIEPAQNVAKVAREAGIPTISKFFGVPMAQELVGDGVRADLVIGNNVLAHVPDLNDFVAGMKIILKPDGIITMEFPHLEKLMAHNQFDTIYHEHFSYFSFYAVEKVFAHHGLTLFDVTELPTHGGSLRIYARHADDDSKPVTANVENLRGRELQNGINQLASYQPFGEQVKEVKRKLLEFLIQATREGKSIAAYGAAAKGNTLLNYCGIRTDFIDYVVDASPHKQGLLLPGTHIPVYAPEKITETKPDYLLILPWNLKDEIMKQTDYIRAWGGRFVVPIPEVAVY